VASGATRSGARLQRLFTTARTENPNFPVPGVPPCVRMRTRENPELICFIALSVTAASIAQERWQARSMVVSQRGIVATSQTLASQAGAQILARGGSAVDAAIAANAVLSVVEPMMCGIGGDMFAIPLGR
jgi:hypothetical protein